uniref:RNA-dependent RNA polymerase n=1 Tax=Panagrolaimus sp. ES5 TaxID=591445 RepID=A0AC34GWR3_9BILA
MSTVSCRFIFRKYTAEQIERFLQECKEHTFEFLANFQVGQSVHYSTGNDEFDERDEAQFSFDLKSPEEIGLVSKYRKYEGIVLALADLVSTFEKFQRKYENNGLAPDAIVLFTPLSKDIYPKFFELHSSFIGTKIGFGNIVDKRYFAPTFFFDEPKDVSGYSHDVFEKYLMEHHDMKNVDANMLMICEHDRETLTICFPDILSSNLKLAEHRSADRVVDIKIPYSAIRRLIVKPNCDTDGIRVKFTFQLNYAPSIYIHEKGQSRAGKQKLYFKPPSRYLTWNKGLDLENILSHASCMLIETRDVHARTLLDCLDRFRKSITYSIEYRFLDNLSNWSLRKYTKNVFMDQEDLPDELFTYTNREYFPLVFAVQALISRKGAIYDYFFRTCFNTFDEFLNLVTESFKNDLLNDPDTKVTKTVVALEHMLQIIDRLHDTPEPISTFKSLYDAPGYSMLAEVTSELAKNGYMRVRKIVVTPTRKIFVNPELIMGNRSLRKKGADEMLRLVFRDDNGMNLSGLPPFFITKTVKETLSFSMDVGFRKFSYLSSSNSQLRDHGCYLLAGSPQDVQEFREKCGKFKVEAIPKMMSRIAQVFTQARKCGISITRKEYSDVFDYTGGADGNGKAYTFSDGCGLVSKEFCEKIVQDSNLGDCIPSCYQIRFRGYKGVVTMNSLMDEIREWAKKNGISTRLDQNGILPWYAQSLLFRPSQMKFHGPRDRATC